jgi:hypothetical protein
MLPRNVLFLARWNMTINGNGALGRRLLRRYQEETFAIAREWSR